MRLDYVLYVVAVICLVIAGVFVASGTNVMNLAATVVFLILGIIFAVGGYFLRPKAAAPIPTVPQPSPAEPSPPPTQLPSIEEKVEAPAVPPPAIEVPPPVEEAPVVQPAPAEEVAPTEPTSVPTLAESAKCPNCGTEVSSPRKKWTMAGRPDKSGMKMQLEIGLFDCPNCHKHFRVILRQGKI